MNADAILQTPLDRPDLVFSGVNDEALTQFRTLRAKWHPDRAQRTDVFQHIEALYATRTRMLVEGTWPGAGQTSVTLKNMNECVIRFLRQRKFELGTLYHCPNSLCYVIDSDNAELGVDGAAWMDGFKYPNPKMEDKLRHCVPHRLTHAELANGGVLVVVEKGNDLVSLRDLLDHLGAPLDPRHVAWILTRLHYMASYLEWSGMTHNAIDIDSCFVSPPMHTLALLGGWWYARPINGQMLALPAGSADVWQSALPPNVTASKRATPLLDRELVRLVGRTLLGDPSGATLHRNKRIPAPLAQWVTVPSQRSAVEDYRAWELVRERSFGPRKFTLLDVTAKTIYGG